MKTHAHFESIIYSQLTLEMLRSGDSKLRVLHVS